MLWTHTTSRHCKWAHSIIPWPETRLLAPQQKRNTTTHEEPPREGSFSKADISKGNETLHTCGALEQQLDPLHVVRGAQVPQVVVVPREGEAAGGADAGQALDVLGRGNCGKQEGACRAQL